MPSQPQPFKPASEPEQGEDLQMPHERDEAAGNVSRRPDDVIHQAKKDLDAGQVDTDMRATPGLDAERREQLTGASAPRVEAPVTDSNVGPGSHPKAPRTDRPGAGRRR
jgi:hypothetical protein